MSDDSRRTDLDPTDMIVVLVGSHDAEIMTMLSSQPGVVIHEPEHDVLSELMRERPEIQLINLRDDPLDRMERLRAECDLEIRALGKAAEVSEYRYFRPDDGTPRSPRQTRRAQRRSRGKRR